MYFLKKYSTNSQKPSEVSIDARPNISDQSKLFFFSPNTKIFQRKLKTYESLLKSA